MNQYLRVVSLVTKRGSKRAQELGRQVYSFLVRQGIKVIEETVPKDCDLVIVLGGDGTLLHIAESAYRADAPILGVNLGGLGYLTEIQIEEIEKVVMSAIRGEADLEKRMLLKVEVLNSDCTSCATYCVLNEVAILRGSYGKVINIPTWAEGAFLTTYRGDGLIISTPTGSTAYNLSAGGPILHPRMEAMILTPVCPFALSARPIILPADSELEVCMEGFSNAGGVGASNQSPPFYVEIDGKFVPGVKSKYKLVVKRAPGHLKLISSPSSGYFKILREKLGWAGHLHQSDP